MEWTGLNELREAFLSFYTERGHRRMDSFSLIPQDDKSLLLINSGMAPLKKYFLGQMSIPENRATTCQKCIRTPDIENVGHTSRHGTFFEMLGNFSFGDYFKEDATIFAWEFITQVVKMPVDRLYISVFEDDDEAYEIWTKHRGVAPDHMVRLGREDNFWEIGSGPCGPCSEIYFDRGEEYGCGKPTCGVGCDCDRYVEFWNLVFTQFISDGEGHYTKMERGNIDTGMGLERLACICQGVDNLFEVDTIQKILHHVEHIAGVKYKDDPSVDVSIRVITDHIRSTVFMIGDGIGPSNNGRGYVLRRLLRRAARHGRLLGIMRPFLSEVADTVINENRKSYPYLNDNREYIKRVILAEEETFAKTIDQGSVLLDNILDEMDAKGEKVLDGETAFRLNDTYGFPLDLTKEIVAERGFTVDEEGFHTALNEQKIRSREDTLKKKISWETDLFKDLEIPRTEFVGYESMECDATVLFMVVNNESTETASEGDLVTVVLDKTPFYAESGGQVGDKGTITVKVAHINVTDTQKTPEGFYTHIGTVENGLIKIGDKVHSAVDEKIRKSTMRNHTSAHLLQAALRQVLGDHVHQAGSYVDGSRSRFDFSHYEAVKPDELRKVEQIVNEKILEAREVFHRVMPIEEARKLGAMALFGEKYGDTVRVIDVPGYSTEFCGGTHVYNTSELGLYKILSESSVASGIRRIEATTGYGVLALMDEMEGIIGETSCVLKAGSRSELAAKAAAEVARGRELQKENDDLKGKLAGNAVGDIIAGAVQVGALKVYTAKVEGGDDALRKVADEIKGRDASAVILLAGAADGKVNLCAACGSDAVKAGIKAGDLVKIASAHVGGSGGGKPDMAMAGGKDPAGMENALASAVPFVTERV